MPTSFEDLRVLKTAEQIADSMWKRIGRWDGFARDVVGRQLARAADSVGANIAESFGRYHYSEKLQFLYYARGSLFETKYWVNRALARALLAPDEGNECSHQLTDLAREINAFAGGIKTLRQAESSSGRSPGRIPGAKTSAAANPTQSLEPANASSPPRPAISKDVSGPRPAKATDASAARPIQSTDAGATRQAKPKDAGATREPAGPYIITAAGPPSVTHASPNSAAPDIPVPDTGGLHPELFTASDLAWLESQPEITRTDSPPTQSPITNNQ